MKKRHLKIVISSFIIGIIILTIGLFANQSSDIISLGNNQLANTFSSIQQAQTGDLANEEESKGYQPISGINFKAGQSGAGADSDFIALLRTIFNWGIAIAVILATLAVIVGAVQYMTTDAIYDKKEGRQRMTSAIGGLILALMSWLILFTINENIFASNFLLKLQELKEKNAENQESKIEAGENNQELEEALDELSEEVVRNNPPLSQNSADDLLSGYNIIRGPSVSTEGMKINTVNVAGSVSSGCCGGQSPLVLSEGTESDTIANQENEGGVFAFDYNDNFEQQENLDEYFLEVIGEEELNSSTLQTPRRANIDGYEVEVTPTFTGWTVEVLPNQEGYSTNNEEVNSNQKSESGSDFLNNETNQNFDIDSNQQNNDNRLTLQEIIDLNRPNNNSDENNETDFEENELSQDGQNILAFQDQAFENVFVKNEDADIVNMSDQLENMILIFRDEC
ncbi:MAG: pilin, partial [Bacteriovoracia bacterium]